MLAVHTCKLQRCLFNQSRQKKEKKKIDGARKTITTKIVFGAVTLLKSKRFRIVAHKTHKPAFKNECLEAVFILFLVLHLFILHLSPDSPGFSYILVYSPTTTTTRNFTTLSSHSSNNTHKNVVDPGKRYHHGHS